MRESEDVKYKVTEFEQVCVSIGAWQARWQNYESHTDYNDSQENDEWDYGEEGRGILEYYPS